MTGEYFSWLSHDDIYYSEKIEKQIEASGSDINKIVYSNVEYVNNCSDKISESNYDIKFSNKELSSGLFVLLNGMANGCSFLIPKKKFEKYGLFNESLRTSNDYEMWFRMIRNESLIFVPINLIKYRLHEDQGTRTEAIYHKESDELWTQIISNVTIKELKNITNSCFDFYFTLARRMQSDGLICAGQEAYNKSKIEYQKVSPLISVIMPCYNSEIYLVEAIESILSQTFMNFELITIDDSSTDKTRRILETYSGKDFRIKVFSNAYDKGISGAMNTGLEKSTGKYITRMDSDDISLESRLELQYNFLESNLKYGLCSVNISLFGDINRDHVFEDENTPLEWLFFWKNPIANAPTMYRSSIIKNNNLKFEKYKSAEDYDFLTKVIRYAKPYMIMEVLYRYRIRENSVFHSNIEYTIANSIKISRRLFKFIVKKNPPKEFDNLTVFKEFKEKELDIIKVSVLMKMVLDSSKNYWSWSNEEYSLAYEDANKRIMKILEPDYCGGTSSVDTVSKSTLLNKSIHYTKKVLKKGLNIIKNNIVN